MMNFLLRSAPSVSDQLAAHEQVTDMTPSSKPPTTTLEGLIAEDRYPISFTNEDCDLEKDEVSTVNGAVTPPTSKNSVPIGEHHDVSAHEGYIAIPCKELPENWREAADILSFHTLDRSFIFPGEQLHILACLSASKQDTEVITPFKVAAVMSKNGNLDQNVKHPKKTSDTEPNSSPGGGNSNPEEVDEAELVSQTTTTKEDVSESESILRSESHKQHTQTLLERFRNSNFFVRVTDPDGELSSKRNGAESSPSISRMRREKSVNDLGPGRISQKRSHLISVIDRGNFDANAAGGMARSTVDCCSLSNGDIVVLLRVNVGNIFVKHPVLEILQFEKYQNRSHVPSENHDNIVGTNDTADPCGDLLKWLLPLDQTLLPPVRPLSPPPLSSNSSVIANASHKSTFSASSGSQLFSFGHFRSYSMSALPQSTAPPLPASSSSKSSFDLEGWDKFSSQNLVKSQDIGSEGILSFRGVSLEPERFSVRCGLEGIYIPGRRWRRKLEIVEPLEIHSFAADCNTEELLCVQIKNVSPAHIPDIVIFLDTIAIVFEKAPKGGPPISLPVVCIEAGNEHSLPNLALRRGEEHSFVLKPANSIRVPKTNGERSSALPPYSRLGSVGSSVNLPPLPGEAKVVSESSDQYAVLVSCRCNYTESRLFFKQPTSWRPRLRRDLMISVASKMSEQTFGPSGGMSQLPVQVLTLQASNLTSEDLTLTVLAPASFNSLPSVVSLNSAPTSPVGPFVGFMGPGGIMQRLRTMPVVPESCKEGMKRRSISLNEQDVSTSDVIPSTSLGCTHLWLQSTVPLGCVPSQSTATVKLELLPLTDGIVTLDTLQIAVKEKGVTYIPEHSLKIHATSSIATGII